MFKFQKSYLYAKYWKKVRIESGNLFSAYKFRTMRQLNPLLIDLGISEKRSTPTGVKINLDDTIVFCFFTRLQKKEEFSMLSISVRTLKYNNLNAFKFSLALIFNVSRNRPERPLSELD